MVDLFKRSTRAIQSQSIYLKDWQEPFDQFDLFIDQKDQKIKDRKIEFPTLTVQYCNTRRYNMSYYMLGADKQ